MAKKRLRRNPDAEEVCFFCGGGVPQTDPELVFVALMDPDDYENYSMWGGHSACVNAAVHPSVFFVNPVTRQESGPGL